MKYIADLHVHSKFSRATARNLDLENLYIAAQLKGVTLVGTGDFTHPGWFEELRVKLVPAEPGLYRLDQRLERTCDRLVPDSCRGPVRFILSAEISNIYKKLEKTRKNHNLVLVPDFETAARFSARLDKIGNIHSDGRPILGLDARHLLEILLESSDRAFLIPAHIWTPWFSVLGSKSGFDSIDACFEDLTPYIFAAETGLSSDPPMNWRVSKLDRVTLVSNSDAHSPSNIGREANILDTELSFDSLRSAIAGGDPKRFLGTIEFYPEEGKYHLDGHRNCGVRFWPHETVSNNGCCPVCGKPLTIGVLYRVEELADNENGRKPEKHHPYHRLIPLTDVLSEILRVGPKTKKVGRAYRTAVETLGPELHILQELHPAAIERIDIPLLGEAIRRMRDGRMQFSPGYDGEYGRIKIFDEQERRRLLGQQELFSMPAPPSSQPKTKRRKSATERRQGATSPSTPAPQKWGEFPATAAVVDQLNDEQRRAVNHDGRVLLISAGPGTGKTRTLTHRIVHLISQRGVSAGNILAVTFTNRASREMKARLRSMLPESDDLPLVTTFHGLCYQILCECHPRQPIAVVDDDDRAGLLAEAIRLVETSGRPVILKPPDLLNRIVACKQQILDPDDLIRENTYRSGNGITSLVYRTYQNLLTLQGLVDFEDLIFNAVRILETQAAVQRRYCGRFRQIFVDEYQDINDGQYRLICVLAAPGGSQSSLCVIGDPDQSIYGFRGSNVTYFQRLQQDFPEKVRISLTRNYRSTETILKASFQVIRSDSSREGNARVYSQIEGVQTVGVLELPDARMEAEAVAGTIEELTGGTGFHSLDTGRIQNANISHGLSYADFAVLSRTNEQHRLISEVFSTAGIPHLMASRRDVLKYNGIAELLALLRLVEGCGSYADAERTMLKLATGVGQKTLAAFKLWCFHNRLTPLAGLAQCSRFPISGLDARRQKDLVEFNSRLTAMQTDTKGLPVKEKLSRLVELSGLSSVIYFDTEASLRLDHLLELAASFHTRSRDFLAAVAMNRDTDFYDARAEKVALMTMHAAKGLEFPVVFVTGCEEGLIPYHRNARDKGDEAEERRLFYVAMTRARDQLYLTCARKRPIYGKQVDRVLSPFVADIEERLKRDDSPSLRGKHKKCNQVQLKLF